MNWKEFINQNLLTKTGSLNNRKLNKNFLKEKYEKIFFETSFLPKNIKLSIRLYYLYNNIKSPVLCLNCNKKTKFISFNKGFRSFCSLTCVNESQIVKNKRNSALSKIDWSIISEKSKQTKKEKYNDPNFNNSKKTKETCLKKYGVCCSLHTKENKEKIKKNLLKNYGNESYLGSDQHLKLMKKYHENLTIKEKNEILKKSKQTKKEKYGYENYTNREKSKETCLKKYGVKVPSQNDIIKEKSKETCLEKYGVPFYLQSDQFKKWKKSNGISSTSQLHIKNIEKLNKNFIEQNFIDENGFIKIKEMSIFFNVTLSVIYYKLKEFGINYKTIKSSFENEIQEFLLTHKVNFIQRDKSIISPLELDFYLPDYNLAIEFNGNYYHSHQILNDKNYHLNKTELCEQKGIQLIHIFQYQWEQKQEIVKSIILSKLGIYNKRIYARKCIIKEIDSKTKSQFLEQNHLQGKSGSFINLGLFYNNELVSLMTFGKRKITGGKSTFELIRFCSKLNTQIIGGASKLFKHFLKNYDYECISYANRQISNGKFYEKIGFKFIRNTESNYFYYKGNKILSRMSCQKHKLKNLLENFDINLTEYENMLNNGWNKIYNSGNKLYKYSKED